MNVDTSAPLKCLLTSGTSVISPLGVVLLKAPVCQPASQMQNFMPSPKRFSRSGWDWSKVLWIKTTNGTTGAQDVYRPGCLATWALLVWSLNSLWAIKCWCGLWWRWRQGVSRSSCCFLHGGHTGTPWWGPLPSGLWFQITALPRRPLNAAVSVWRPEVLSHVHMGSSRGRGFLPVHRTGLTPHWPRTKVD